MAVLVETNLLTKRYGDMAALRDCTFALPAGEVLGLLGPNGAGKTTLLRLLMGFLRPSSGSASIDGLDCYRESVKARQLICYLPGDARLFRGMKGRDVLRFFAQVRQGGNLELADKLADRLELDLNRRVAFMSTGMRQKLALASTLSTDTPLLILDEPTANLDPNVRDAVITMVAEAKSRGRTVIFSSHVLSEVEEVCDRVIILRQGELVHTQVMSELRRCHRIRAQVNGPLFQLEEQEGVTVVKQTEEEILLESTGDLTPLLAWLAKMPLTDVSIEQLGLRAVYQQFHSQEKLPQDERRAAEKMHP